MDTAAAGGAQKEDDEERIDEQDIFDRVISFLAAITVRLCSRVLGADKAPFGPVMGKRGEACSAVGPATTGAGSSASGVTTVVASAPRRRAAGPGRPANGWGHRRESAGLPGAPARARGSTGWPCSGPCRRGAPARPGAHTFSGRRG